MWRRLLVTGILAAVASAMAATDPARLEAARQLYGERRNEEAAAAFAALRSEDEREPEPWFYLGLIAMRRDQAEEAAALLAKAVELKSDDAEYSRRLGDACGRAAQKAGLFAKLGWAGKSRAAYERAVQLAPRNIDARLSAMNFYAQAPALAGGGFGKAHREADAIAGLDPVRGRTAKANLFLRENKASEARAVFIQVLKENPDDYPALHELGRIAIDTGEALDDGLAALTRCLTLTPPAGAPGHEIVAWRIGLVHERKGDTTAARTAYEQAIAIDPAFGPAAQALAKLKE